MSAKVAIFGLGNPLMTDDGVAIHLLDRQQQNGELPPDVELIDLGTGGMRLLHQVEGRRKLIFVDCACMGEEAGTLRRFRPDEARALRRFRLHRSWGISYIGTRNVIRNRTHRMRNATG